MMLAVLKGFMACSFVVTACLALSVSSSKRVAIIGATGRLGREAVSQLTSKGIPISCLVRFDPSTVTASDSVIDLQDATSIQVRQYLKSLPNVKLIQGDASSLESLMELTRDCTACLALHGATRKSKLSDIWNKDAEKDAGHAKIVNYEGIGHLITAMQESTSCKRLVRITGKGEDPMSFFSVLINMFGSMAKGWNYEGECLLRKSDINYTIIRPGIMQNMERKDAILKLADNGADLKVTPVAYSDIASLAAECLDYPNAARSTLTAMNTADGEKGEATYAPLLAKVQPDSREFPSTLISEHKRAVRNAVATLGAVFAVVLAGTVSLLKSWFFG